MADPEPDASTLLSFLANRLTVGAQALYREKFGVGVTEWRILALLAVEAPIPAARICQVLGLDKAPISRCLAGMARAGLVRAKQDREDARRRPVALTAAGRKLHGRMAKLAAEREAALLAGVKPAEQKALVALLVRLRGNVLALEG